ncbi:hypothetical protein AQUCO_16800001v1 [Aquilegia coerulea]|uniref:non-specific serine/threonine protein kinase n=1 Tax=Aquilegia coerulea TaxID=218851 RepID=A0A2G5C0S6_AQUCA|nr:hypothetical protein AQUCO_16800001v1 [Aquilegia coerulea]
MAENQYSVVNEFISEMARENPQQFSYGQLISFTSNFQFHIGSGGFGDVYKGVFPNQFMSEVGTMGRTYHRNLIKLYGFCFDANMKALVYEYMENGSFDRILYENSPRIKWVQLYDIAIEIAKGLSYLHEYCYPQIIHHDIKPANVLLDSNLSPKVTDFGLAKLNRDLSHFAQTGYRGTPGYAAPEVSMNHPSVTYKCDVFSYGIMLFDILRRKKYTEGDEWFPAQVWEHLQIGKLDKIIMECGIGVEDKEDAEILSKVALLCAQYKAHDRPSMSTVVKMLEGEIPPWTPVDPFPYYESTMTKMNILSTSERSIQIKRYDLKIKQKCMPTLLNKESSCTKSPFLSSNDLFSTADFPSFNKDKTLSFNSDPQVSTYTRSDSQVSSICKHPPRKSLRQHVTGECRK